MGSSNTIFDMLTLGSDTRTVSVFCVLCMEHIPSSFWFCFVLFFFFWCKLGGRHIKALVSECIFKVSSDLFNHGRLLGGSAQKEG